MKQTFYLLLAALIAIAPSAYAQRAWDGVVATSFGGGWGTESSPYLITNAAEFAYLLKQTQKGEEFAGRYFALTNDIVFNASVEQSGKVFAGVLDGRAYRIHGINQKYELFSTLSGTIKNLGLVNMRKARTAFASTVTSTGRIVNCYYQGSMNYWDSYDRYKSIAGFAWLNHGRIENSYIVASTNVEPDYWVRVYDYVQTNYDDGYMANCYSKITWSYYQTYRHKEYESNYGTMTNITTDLAELNAWAAEHSPEYSAWENEEQPVLSIFEATMNETHTVTFDPVFGTCPEAERTLTNGTVVGELPQLESYDGMNFVGWYNGIEKADADYPVYSNITLKAKWEKLILEQPTAENATVVVSDPSHARYQWYKSAPGSQSLDLAANSSGPYPWRRQADGSFLSSNRYCHDSASSASFDLSVKAGDQLTVEYSVDSEAGFDRFIITWKGNIILDRSGNQQNQKFEYTFTDTERGLLRISYSKDSSDNRGEDRATVKSCQIGSAPEAIESYEASLDFDKVGDGQIAYCEIRYTNDDTILVSDPFVVDHPSPYKLYVVPCEIRKAGVTQIPVAMKNAEPVVTLQCNISIPEGLDVVRNDHGDYDLVATERLDATHQLLANDRDGKIIVLSYSSGNYPFAGTEGVIFYIPVTVANLEAGTFDINITDVSFTKEDLGMVQGPEAYCSLAVADYEPGDANGDGMVNATDIAALVAAILGNPPANYVEGAADLNNDGTVNATDIAHLVSIILRGNNPSNN